MAKIHKHRPPTGVDAPVHEPLPTPAEALAEDREPAPAKSRTRLRPTVRKTPRRDAVAAAGHAAGTGQAPA